jgi:hypothetical protein
MLRNKDKDIVKVKGKVISVLKYASYRKTYREVEMYDSTHFNLLAPEFYI